MELEQQLQEDEYEFPYHYIPTFNNGYIESYKYWSWGYKYLASLEIIKNYIAKINFKSIIDVGCGDGRLTGELQNYFHDKEVVGIDYSEKAISIAQLFNPTVQFHVRDIISESIDRTFDIITLIEVLEHIPPARVNNFIKGLKKLMHSDSTLILTVPHVNQLLNEKHYQHYSSSKLRSFLEPYFTIQESFYFDPSSLEMKFWSKLLNNSAVIIKSPFILRTYYKRYLKTIITSEGACLRMGVVCTLK
jgi:SAM-dependent methyltransferase